ncbi:transcriptional regulator [Enterobacterales bacterium CwR94]|nr:transcriptional regulator [Enterobacterales bacterium CwR94]
MTTMLDVAKRAGVSKATVSRVLAGHHYVSKTARDKVNRAIAETGYRPNLIARNLATNRTHSIGLMVPNTLYNGPFFSELIFQAATLTEKMGSKLVLADGKHTAEQERQAIEWLIDMRCDALIAYPRYLSVDEIDALIPELPAPLMIVNRQSKTFPQFSVCADHLQDTFNAVDWLIQQGHREVMFIAGLGSSYTGRSRLQGYLAALEKHQIARNDALIIPGDWTPDGGKRVMHAFLQQRPAHFTALVASNDDMAIGAANALHEAGLRVPEDVSLLSFDNMPMSSYFIPALTTVHVPVAEMVAGAVAQLSKLLDGEAVAPLPLLNGTLIQRQSVTKGPYA